MATPREEMAREETVREEAASEALNQACI